MIIPEFDWNMLSGKELEIRTFNDSDGFLVLGIDNANGDMYVLEHKPIVESVSHVKHRL